MSRESAYFIVRNLDGKHDLKELKQELDTLRGVSSVSVNTQNHLVSVDYDSSGVTYDRIEHRLNRLGYEIAADASNIQTPVSYTHLRAHETGRNLVCRLLLEKKKHEKKKKKQYRNHVEQPV